MPRFVLMLPEQHDQKKDCFPRRRSPSILCLSPGLCRPCPAEGQGHDRTSWRLCEKGVWRDGGLRGEASKELCLKLR